MVVLNVTALNKYLHFAQLAPGDHPDAEEPCLCWNKGIAAGVGMPSVTCPASTNPHTTEHMTERMLERVLDQTRDMEMVRYHSKTRLRYE